MAPPKKKVNKYGQVISNPYIDAIMGLTQQQQTAAFGTPPYGARPGGGAGGLPQMERYLVSPGWGSDEDYRNALLGQWDYASAENLMRQGDIADEAAVNAAIGRAEQDQTRFMADLGTALRRTNLADTSRLAGSGRLNSGASAALAMARNEEYQKQSTASAQELLDRKTDWRNSLTQRKQDRQARFLDQMNAIQMRLLNDPRYQPRDPVYGERPIASTPTVPGTSVPTMPGGGDPRNYGGTPYVPTNPGWGAAGSTAKYQAQGGGPWSALYARYGTGVKAGSDKNGRPYVIVNGVKRYA